jgi:hypothetical protein
MNIFLDTARFFYVLLEQVKPVNKSKKLVWRAYLPAARIELLLKIEELKNKFYERT